MGEDGFLHEYVDCSFQAFKRLHKLVNMEEVPLSAYLLLCQAMRNELNKAMNADPEKFDQLLGRDQRHS